MATSKNNPDKDAVQEAPGQDEAGNEQPEEQAKTEENDTFAPDTVVDKSLPSQSTPERKDLSRLCTINWPTNRVIRSVINCDIRDMALETHQTAAFITLPDTFVFEGLDIIPTKPVSPEIELQAELEDGRILGRFTLKGEIMVRQPVESALCVGDGTLLRNQRIILRNVGDAFNGEGRLAFVFKGYSLEHWR